MPILRLNAGADGIALHGSPASAAQVTASATKGTGPVIVMIHGFKYDPDCRRHSPHRLIFSGASHPIMNNKVQWLHHLGFGNRDNDAGLAIVFAWRARGSLWRAQRAAVSAGRQLAQVVRSIKERAPHRPVHVISHSMGSEVIFEALDHLPACSVDRIVALTGASYASRAVRAMTETPAGRTASLINVTSRENDPFDFLFERLIASPEPGDGAMGQGIDLPNAVTLQLDCPRTLATLSQFGGQIAPAVRRMCHWSIYTRPGALQFYGRLLRQADDIPLGALRQALPEAPAPRWSRMLGAPNPGLLSLGARFPGQTLRKVL